MNIFSRVTLRTLRKNRTRTIVTIVGIILSAAMFTAVATSITSLQRYLHECAVYLEGNWHVSFDSMPAAEMEQLNGDDLVERAFYAQTLGYAAVDSENEYKPYLYVLGADEAFFEQMPVHLTEGRLPENSGEILLPEHLEQNGGVSFRPGDRLTLALGDRIWDGEVLGQHTPYLPEEPGSPAETLEVRETRTYTVAGLYERPNFEGYEAPGYTAITAWDPAQPTASVAAWFRLTDPKAAFDFAAGDAVGGRTHYFPENSGSSTNSDVLMSEGASRYGTFYRVLYSMGAILMGIIMFGSVSLIYNAFSISVSERTRQFGLLSSVGATKRQIRHMVLDEALYVSAAGIPLGIAGGVAGIGVTLHLIGGKFYSFYGVKEVPLRLTVSPAALLAAAAVAFVTVLISAWVPSRRAMRVTAIEAIRQTGDVSVRRRDVRTSRLTYRLFGLEGLLAKKHFRRNRRRYRATVVSLFLSVVLFISASSFCTYLTDTVTGTFEDHDYDISYTWMEGMTAEDGSEVTPQRVLEALAGTEGVTRASAAAECAGSWEIPYDQMPQETQRRLEANGYAAGEPFSSSYFLCGVDEATYRAYLREQGLSEAEYLDTDHPKAVAMAKSRVFNPETGRVETLELLRPSVETLNLPILNQAAYEALLAERGEEPLFWEEEEALRGEATEDVPFSVGSLQDELPFGLNSSEYWGVYLIYPLEYLEAFSRDGLSCAVYFKTTDHTAAMERLTQAADEAGLDPDSLYDVYAVSENDRNTVTIVKVFAYGFITLISLISLANVFNTISTNLMLRRREFAMLRSVGMTRRGFGRMMDFECLLYGAKALLWGLPAAGAVTYLIFRSVGIGYDTAFYLPWSAVAIAVGSVFLVVFATMMYGMRKIRRDNPIDALRNENL